MGKRERTDAGRGFDATWGRDEFDGMRDGGRGSRDGDALH